MNILRWSTRATIALLATFLTHPHVGEAVPGGTEGGHGSVEISIDGIGSFHPLMLSSGGLDFEVYDRTTSMRHGDSGWRFYDAGRADYHPLEIVYAPSQESDIERWYQRQDQRGVTVRFLDWEGEAALVLEYGYSSPVQLNNLNPQSPTLVLQPGRMQRLGEGTAMGGQKDGGGQLLVAHPQAQDELSVLWSEEERGMGVEVEITGPAGTMTLHPRLIAGGEVLVEGGETTSVGKGQFPTPSVVHKSVTPVSFYGGPDFLPVAPLLQEALRAAAEGQQPQRSDITLRFVDASGREVRTVNFLECFLVRYLAPAADASTGEITEEVITFKANLVETSGK